MEVNYNMETRFIVRTTSNLSFAGNYCANHLGTDEAGILIKPSMSSELKIWCPLEEIQCILMSDGQLLNKQEIVNKFNIVKSDEIRGNI